MDLACVVLRRPVSGEDSWEAQTWRGVKEARYNRSEAVSHTSEYCCYETRTTSDFTFAARNASVAEQIKRGIAEQLLPPSPKDRERQRMGDWDIGDA